MLSVEDTHIPKSLEIKSFMPGRNTMFESIILEYIIIVCHISINILTCLRAL